MPPSYDEGDVVIKEGDTEDWAIFLLRGNVEVIISKKKRLTISAPDYVGENGMFVPGTERTASVVASTLVEALTIDRARFFKLCVSPRRRGDQPPPHHQRAQPAPRRRSSECNNNSPLSPRPRLLRSAPTQARLL